MIGLQAGGAGVGGHGGRGVAGGDAGHALHAQPQRLRHAAGHAVVFERSGGIEALVLEGEPVEAAILGGPRRVEQRRVALAQRHHARVIVEETE